MISCKKKQEQEYLLWFEPQPLEKAEQWKGENPRSSENSWGTLSLCATGEIAIQKNAPLKSIGSFISKLEQLDKLIDSSREFLEWTEEDCEEIGKGWTEETWSRSVSYLRAITDRIWYERGILVDLPDIEPGRNGSIDIHWDYFPDYELIINVKADKSAEATFYGDNKDKIKIKGATPLNSEGGELWLWLTQRMKSTLGR